MLFKKPGDDAEDNRYRVVEQRKIDADANKISLVNEATNASTDSASDTTGSTGESADNDVAVSDTTGSDSDASGDDDVNVSTPSPERNDDADSAGSTESESPSGNSSEANAGGQQATNTTTQTNNNNPSNETASSSTPAPEPSTSANQPETASDDSDAIAEPAPQTADTGSNVVLESPNWILTQDASLFTVQMSASTEREVVEKFLQQNPLEPPNSVFSFDRDGTTWYALVHGLYPSIDAARAAVERLPPAALTNQPWIRAIGRIQRALRDQN